MADLGMPNTEMYGTIKPLAIPNVIGMAHEYAETKNAMQTNQINQQTIEARQAIGPILQGAIQPDGTLDYNKAFVMMSANPKTSWMAPDFLKQGLANQGAQLDNATKALDLAIKQQGAIGDALTPLLQYGVGVTKGQAMNAIGQLKALGVIDMPRAIAAATALPDTGPELYQHILEFSRKATGAKTAMESVYGTITSHDYGTGTVITAESPVNGVRPIGQVNAGRSPELQARLVEGQDQTGTTHQAPMSAAFPPTGTAAAPGLVGAPGGVAGAGVGASNGGTPAPGAAPMPTAPQGPPTGQGGPSATVPPVGTPPVDFSVKAISPADRLQTEDFAKWKNSLADNVEQNNGMLMQFQEARRELGPGGAKAGGGAAMRTLMGQIAQAAGLPKEVQDQIANGSLHASQVFNKISETNIIQIARQLMGGQGRITNMDVGLLKDALPSLDTDPKAIEAVYNLFARMSRYAILEQKAMPQYEEAARTHPGKVRLGDFRTWWQQQAIHSGGIDVGEHSGELRGTSP